MFKPHAHILKITNLNCKWSCAHKVSSHCIYGRRFGLTKRNHLGSANFHWLKFTTKEAFQDWFKRFERSVAIKGEYSEGLK